MYQMLGEDLEINGNTNEKLAKTYNDIILQLVDYDVHQNWLKWMKEVHTGCFKNRSFY